MQHLHAYPKTALALFVGLYTTGALAYQETGVLGNTKSWESAEYLNDWALGAMKASTAYALGANGTSVQLGVMDSGMLLSHPAFKGGLVTAVDTVGNYAKTDYRYPDEEKVADRGLFNQGEAFNVSGAWHQGMNDSHGTHVGGSIAATRDGEEMHGVAWGAKLASANTGGTDSMTYGPNQDYNYFLQGYTALAKAGAKVVNNSWGSNRHLRSAFEGATGYYYDYDTGEVTEYINDALPDDHLYIKNLDVAKRAYYQFVTKGEKSWMDAAYEVARDNQFVQVFTAGNRRKMPQPFTRAMLPYFRPDIENLWVNVTGVDDNDKQQYNFAGDTKYWTIAAPALNIYSSKVSDEGEAFYKTSSGTSMAAPHVTGALGVVMQRYPYLTPAQARDVLLTTARQAGSNGRLEGWTSAQGVPDSRWGWGIIDLGKAMFGPGQFLGTMNVNLAGQNDIWSNDISDTALKFRKQEDAQEAAEWATRKAQLETLNLPNAEQQAELKLGYDREAARLQRAMQGYQGSLVKSGDGTLTLAGNNSFTGTIEVAGGRLKALNQAVGSSQNIAIKDGAELEIAASVEVTKPSETGYTTETRTSNAQTVKATVEKGGALYLADRVANLAVTFEQGALVKLPSLSETQKADLRANPSQSLNYHADGAFNGLDNVSVQRDDFALIGLQNQSSATALDFNLQKVAMATVARSENERAIANAIDAATASSFYNDTFFANLNQVYQTLDSLNVDAGLREAQQRAVDSLMLGQKLRGSENIRSAEIGNQARLWLDGWANNLRDGTLRTRSQTQLLGVDITLPANASAGVFAGANQARFKQLGEKQRHNSVIAGVKGSIDLAPITLSANAFHQRGKQTNALALANAEKRYFRQTQIGLEASYNGWLKPFVGVDYQRTDTDGVNGAEVKLDKQHRNLTLASVGVRPSVPFNLGGVAFAFNAEAAYQRALGGQAVQERLIIANQSEATLKSDKLRNLWHYGAGIEAKFATASVRIDYQGVKAGNIKANGVNAKVAIEF